MAFYLGKNRVSQFASGINNPAPPSTYDGSYKITPAASSQLLQTKNSILEEDLVVSTDINLIPESIKKDVEIFGVTGTAEPGFPPNGMSWTLGSSDIFLTMKYANGVFIGVTEDGIIKLSTNGVNWYKVGNCYYYESLYEIVYGDNGLWFILACGDTLYYSINNGITWAEYEGFPGVVYTIAFANGMGIGNEGANNSIFTFSSPIDGFNITYSSNYTGIGYFQDIVYGNGLWVSTDYWVDGSGVYYSMDGLSWTQSNITNRIEAYSIKYQNGIWHICAGDLYWSEDGKNWTQAEGVSDATSVTYADNKWLVLTVNGIAISIDGKKWYYIQDEQDDLGSTFIVQALNYANIWIAAPRSDDHNMGELTNGAIYAEDSLYYSLTGTKWYDTSIDVYTFEHGKNLWVASGPNGTYYSLTWGDVLKDEIITWLEFRGNEEFSLSTYNTTANWDGTLYYSTDTENWNTWDGSEISSSGNKLYLRGSGNTKITGSNLTTYRWVFSGNDTLRIEAIGRIDNLLDWETVLNDEEPEMASNCYRLIFYDCTFLTKAPELPATTLADFCYRSMFHGCTSLTKAPKLPATTLAGDCYSFMFEGCTSLTTAPELPATTLAEGCYYGMFEGCTSLTTAPELLATTLASYCYGRMFLGCTSLVTAPELPATILTDYCYNEMFHGCTSLTKAPELPATTLAEDCYYCMLYNCTALNLYSTPTGTATYAWTAPASTYTTHMFYKVPLDDDTSTVDTPTEGTTYYWDTGSSSSGGTELISFTIDGTTYQAEEGMTWAEWCDSSYNTIGMQYRYLDECIIGPNNSTLLDSDGFLISNSNTIIISNEAYTLNDDENDWAE